MNDAPHGDELRRTETARRWTTMRRFADDREFHATAILCGYFTEAMHKSDAGIRVGVVCDTSEAMAEHSAQMASLTWVLLRAASHARTFFPDPFELDVHTFAVSADFCAPWMLGPGIAHEIHIPGIKVSDRVNMGRTVDAASDLASLDQPDAARLLVLITDRTHWAEQNTTLRDLRQSGCGLLWLRPTDATATDTIVMPCGATFGFEAGDNLHRIRSLGETLRDEMCLAAFLGRTIRDAEFE